MMRNIYINTKQKGAALAISLFILTIVTFIGVSSMVRSINLEKMAFNQYNTLRAFQSAELTIRSAETWINQLVNKPTPTDKCTGTPCDIIWDNNALGATYGGANYTENWWAIANNVTNNDWWNNIGRDIDSVSTTTNVEYVSQQPTFFIEEIGFIPDDLSPQNQAAGIGVVYYRITARGLGSEAAQGGISPSQVQLQSIYSKRFN
jgi:type IV pilus assembly protein PilX